MNIKIQKILQYILLGGVFIIPFIPFIVPSGMFFPFITGKNFTFRIIVEILLGTWAVLAYWDASYRIKWSWILAMFATLIGVIALADFFGANPYKSMWSNYERMGGFVGLTHLFAYFLVIISVLKTEKLWIAFFNTWLGASALMGIYGIFQYAGVIKINQGGVRMDGTFGNAEYLAAYSLFNIFIAVFVLLKQKREVWLRVVYCFVIVLNLMMLYFTETRGAILGLLGGVVVSAILIAVFEKKNILFKKTAIGVLIGLLFIVVGFFAIKNTDFVKENRVLSRFASISLHETTTESRFMIWNMAWKGFKEHPVLGWGQENFNFVFNKYYDPGMYGQEPWFDRAHNIIFDWLIVGGILGLLAYLSLFVAGLYSLWSRVGSLSLVSKSVLTGLLAGYFFSNLFVFDNLISYIMFFSILGYIHSINTKDSKVESFMNKIATRIKTIFIGKVMSIVVAPLAVIIVMFSVYFFNYEAMAANFTLIDALKPHPQEKGLLTNLKLFKQTIADNSFGTSEAREQLTQATFIITGIPTVSPKIKDSFLTLANSQLKKQIEEVPGDARHRITYASFLGRYAKYDEAIAQYKEALKLSPEKQAIYFGLIGVYLNKGDVKKALSFAKYAFELKPEYKEARKIYALTAIYNKDYALVKKLLIPVFGTVTLDDNRFIQAYATVGQYDKGVLILKNRVKKDPTNTENLFALSGAYLKNGEKQNAIKEIEKAIKINPKLEKQGKYYIKEIRAGRTP